MIAFPGVPKHWPVHLPQQCPQPPRPRELPWDEGERAQLRALWSLVLVGVPHWARCEAIGFSLGRSALAVHEEVARINAQNRRDS